MEGFWSYNKLKSEIKELKQIYDFTFHLYLQEHEKIAETISNPKIKYKNVLSMKTTVGTITHSLNSLFMYTQENYPRKLRQLVLINLITSLEVYFTNLVREIATRDFEPFKPENERADYTRNHLFSFSTLKGIEDDLLSKDIRKLTSGGLEESCKFFEKRFKIEFKNLGVDYKVIEEIHERRHLFVHRNGVCDAQYIKSYPQFGFRIGKHIELEHEYVMYALDKILEFAGKINQQCLKKFPVSKRKIISVTGVKKPNADEIKLLIEFETRKENFNIDSEILNRNITKTLTVRDFTLQHIIFEKRYQVYCCGSQKQLGQIVYVFKQNPDILILNKTEIDF